MRLLFCLLLVSTLSAISQESRTTDTINSTLVTQFDESGNIITEGLIFQNSILNSSFNSFTDSSIIYKGFYKNGLREGLWIAKNGVTGRVLYKGTFRNGLAVNNWQFSLLENENEKKIEINFNEHHQADGVYNFWYKGKLRLTGNYKKGKQVGLWRSYYNGTPSHFYQFSQDSIVRGTIKRWYRNGNLQKENILLNDTIYQYNYLENGSISGKNYKATADSNLTYESYYEHDGKKIKKKQLTLSETNKYLIYYYENNVLLSKHEKSQNNYLEGSYVVYYKNGKTKEEGTYLKGERFGKFNYYNEQGELKETKQFVNGKQYFKKQKDEICYCIDTISDNNGGFTPSLGNLISPNEAVGHSRLFQIDTSLFNSKLFYKNLVGTQSMTILAYEDVFLKVSENISVNITGCRKGKNPANFYFDYSFLPNSRFLAKPKRLANFQSPFVSIKIPENAIYNQRTDSLSLTNILLNNTSLKYNSKGKSKEALSITVKEVCPDSIYLSTSKLRIKLSNKIAVENKNKFNLKRNIDGIIRLEGSFNFDKKLKLEGNINFSITEKKLEGVILLDGNNLETRKLTQELKSNDFNPVFPKKIETYLKFKPLIKSESKYVLTTIVQLLKSIRDSSPDSSWKQTTIILFSKPFVYIRKYGFRSRKRYYKLKYGVLKKRKVVDYYSIRFKKSI